jgi:protein-disulfide isomerase
MSKLIKIVFLVLIVGLVALGSVAFLNKEKIGILTSALTSQEAADKAIKFINEKLLSGRATSSLISVTEESGLYKFRFSLEGKEYDFYISRDGKILFDPEFGIKTDEQAETAQETAQAATNAPKSDKPNVKVFVMTYCPYGLLAQKMMLPAYNLLKDKADIGVYFVYYAMHGKQELDENLNQYCIQKEQKAKYSSYLSCFVKEGKSAACLTEAGIDTAKLASCVSKTDTEYGVTTKYNDKSTWLSGQYPKFDVEADLNTQYKVGGSPTIVINDTVVNVNPRTPEAFKAAICQAFNSQPEECAQTLSNEAPSAGLGEGTGSAGSDAACGD